VGIAYDAFMSETSEVQTEAELAQPGVDETADEPTQPAVENGEPQKDQLEAEKLAAKNVVAEYREAFRNGDTRRLGEIDAAIQGEPMIAKLVAEPIEEIKKLQKEMEAIKKELGEVARPLLVMIRGLSEEMQPWHLLNQRVAGEVRQNLEVFLRRISVASNPKDVAVNIIRLDDLITQRVGPAAQRSMQVINENYRGRIPNHALEEMATLRTARRNIERAKIAAISLMNRS